MKMPGAPSAPGPSDSGCPQKGETPREEMYFVKPFWVSRTFGDRRGVSQNVDGKSWPRCRFRARLMVCFAPTTGGEVLVIGDHQSCARATCEDTFYAGAGPSWAYVLERSADSGRFASQAGPVTDARSTRGQVYLRRACDQLVRPTMRPIACSSLSRCAWPRVIRRGC